MLEPGSTPDGRRGFTDSKQDTGTITWQRPDGTPYTLTQRSLTAPCTTPRCSSPSCPGRQLLDPATFDTGDKASQDPRLVVRLRQRLRLRPRRRRAQPRPRRPRPGRRCPRAAPSTLSFKSSWDIEWDYDYGYVLTTTDGGKTYTSHASENGYTTSNTDPTAGNPNQNACQDDLRQRHHRHQRLLRRPAPRRSTASSATPRRRSSWPTATTSATSPAPRRRCAAVQLRHRPGPGPAGLVHRRPQGHRDHAARREVLLDDRLRDRRRARRPAGLQRRLPRGPEHRPAVHPGLEVPRGRRRVRAGPRLLPRDARPLRASTSTATARPTATRSAGRPASTWPTPTRRTATATPAPTTRRRSRRSTPPRPGQRVARPRRRRLHRGGGALDVLRRRRGSHRQLRGPVRHRPGTGVFQYDCLGFRCSR